MIRFYAASLASTQGVESQFSEAERQSAKRVAQQSLLRLRASAGFGTMKPKPLKTRPKNSHTYVAARSQPGPACVFNFWAPRRPTSDLGDGRVRACEQRSATASSKSGEESLCKSILGCLVVLMATNSWGPWPEELDANARRDPRQR